MVRKLLLVQVEIMTLIVHKTTELCGEVRKAILLKKKMQNIILFNLTSNKKYINNFTQNSTNYHLICKL